jgi:hypothetical protein
MTGHETFEHSNVFSFTANLIGAFIDASSEKYFLNEKVGGKWLRTIDINTGNIATTKFDLTNEDKELMFENGYKAAALFFDVRDDMDLVFEEIKHIKSNVDYTGISSENR